MNNRIRRVFSRILQSFRSEPQYLGLHLGGRDLRVLKGTFRMKVDKDDAWFATLAMSAKVIFDIGANVGYTALLANLYGRPRDILLVDANAEALGIALRNLAMNNMALNCRFHRAFVSSSDSEEIKFYTVGTGAAGSMYPSHAKTASAANSFFFIGTITLDTLSEMLDLIPDLVKIDVEGSEHLVLEGADRILRKGTPIFLVEMHATEEVPMIENARRVIHWCENVGYHPYYLRSHELLLNPEMIAHRGKCHLLLLPAKASYPNQLKTIEEGSPLP